MKYRSDIDGLRAVAVLPVLWFHAHFPGLSGGFVGVDIFFVISGFLISSLLVDELARNEFSIVRFYQRRFRRIMPALFTMFVLVAILAAFILLPPDMADFCRGLLSATFFVSNIYFWRSANYFDGGSDFKPLLHTWSLGVEEQFYTVMPLILFAIAKWSKSRYTPWLLALTVLSFALSAWGLTNAPTATFYGIPTRFWELSVGALLAVAGRGRALPPLAREGLGVAGALLIVYAMTMLSETSSFPGWNALYPCLGAAALIFVGMSGGSRVSALLGSAPLVWVGKLSYSLYLWHWPLLALARYNAMRDLTVPETGAVLLTSLACAYLSLRYVETPFRQKTPTFRVGPVFASAGIVASVIACIGMATNGYQARYPDFVMQNIPGKEQYNYHTCFLDKGQQLKEWRGNDCFLSKGRGQPVLLWGDSFAAHYAPGIHAQAQYMTADVLQYTSSLCPPLFGYYTAARPECEGFNDNLINVLKQYQIHTVVISARWEALITRGVTPQAVAATVHRLMSMGVKVYVIGQSPVFNNDVQTLFAQAGHKSDTLEASAPLSFDTVINAQFAAALPPGTFIDPLARLCQDGTCDYRENGEYLMFDAGHFSVAGSKRAVAKYFPFFNDHLRANASLPGQ